MSIKTEQQLKTAKIIYFSLSLLINTSLQIQAKDIGELDLDDVKRIIGVQKPAVGLMGYRTKIGIIDGYFDPKSDTESSLSKSTKRAFSKQAPQSVAFRAHAIGHDHANHVSSIIHQIAPKAKLRVIDMYDEPSVKDASGHNARLIAAINAAIKSKVDFINISQRISPDNDGDGKISKGLKKAFYKARNAGIGIIKSAGNDNELSGSTPYTKSLSKLLYEMKGSMVIVAATAYDADYQENIGHFSNKAGIAYKYTVSAPGTDILAYGASNKLVKMSGTSMASPVVTATASLLKEAYPALSAKNILNSIRRSARKVSFDQTAYLSEGKYGLGVVDFHGALMEAEKINKLKPSKVQ